LNARLGCKQWFMTAKPALWKLLQENIPLHFLFDIFHCRFVKAQTEIKEGVSQRKHCYLCGSQNRSTIK
jgi:hypothetical protein